MTTRLRELASELVEGELSLWKELGREQCGAYTVTRPLVEALVNRVLTALVRTPEATEHKHRCSGCGLTWSATEAGSVAAELCGDCWRKVQPILHDTPEATGESRLREAPKPQAKKLRDRATMNVLTCEEPYPNVTKKIVRQLLSALEEAERFIATAGNSLLAEAVDAEGKGAAPTALCVCGHKYESHWARDGSGKCILCSPKCLKFQAATPENGQS